jgi:Tfp pilus assembly protein FimT
MRPCGRSSSHASAFTLVELMIVISIMMLLMSFAAPTMSGILKGKKTDQALSAVSAVLENARMEAMVQNTYIWVGFLNKKSSGTPAPPSGQDEVWMMSFRGKTGEKRPSNDGQIIPASSLRRLEGISILDLASLPELVSNKVNKQSNDTAMFGDFIKAPPSPISIRWAGTTETGQLEFNQLILFTPRGEALLENGDKDKLPSPVPYVSLGLGKTIDGSVIKADKDMAAILVGGFSGRVSVVRP